MLTLTGDLAYRARGTVYSVLTVLLSVMALEAKHLKLGLLNMHTAHTSSSWSFGAITANRFLFFAVLAGIITPLPIIYIPIVNRTVFRHSPLTWEWALVLGSTVSFVALVESWKAGKRRRLRRIHDTITRPGSKASTLA